MPADKNTLQRVAMKIVSEGSTITHLGTGGFGSTFKVTGSHEPYALKIIDPGVSDPARVNRELSALQRVKHPGVVPFLDHGDTEWEQRTFTWLSMGFIEGESLAQKLSSNKQYTVSESLRILRDIVSAAAAIWKQDTAHRDLSPANILLRADNSPVIVDLGLARHVDDETLTQLPTPGTPGWMSPEQVGSAPTHGDWRSDQFVIGCIGYLLLTGLAPFSGKTFFERWHAPANNTPTPVRNINHSVPRSAADIIERMMQNRPHRRYLKTSDLLSDLELTIQSLDSVQPAPESTIDFLVNIGQRKNFAEGNGLSVIAPDGIVLDGRAGRRIEEFTAIARSLSARSIVDPVTHYSRSPEPARPAGFTKLPYGKNARLTGFSNQSDRADYCQAVLEEATKYTPNTVIAPYFYANEGEIEWVRESLLCASTFTQIIEHSTNKVTLDVWTGVAIHSTWLSDASAREILLDTLTSQQMNSLYLLVDTSQPSFAPLADIDVIEGFHDVLMVMREAGIPVIVGKRASSGLLLLALGASGWSTGAAGNLMNMSPHPESVENGGGRPIDRVYVPKLLNSVAVDTYALMRKSRPDLVDLSTTEGAELLRQNPSLDKISTEQSILLAQHNLVAQRDQVHALASLPAARRVADMRERIREAVANYGALPPTRLPGDDGGFLKAWASALS